MGGHIFTLPSKMHQCNRAREISVDNFTFYSVQAKIMTPCARRVLAGRGVGGDEKGREAMIKSVRMVINSLRKVI